MKRTKAQTNYRLKDKTTVNCGVCAYMEDDGHCTKVQGLVDRKHVCDLFRRRTS